MIGRIGTGIGEWMFHKGKIEEEKIDAIRYSVEILCSEFLEILTMIVYGVITGKWIESFMFVGYLLLLRKEFQGFHASTIAAKTLFNDNETEQILGKELVFEGEIYKVSGVVAEDKLYEIANSYPTYSQTYNIPTVFIDYHKLSTLAEPMEMDEHLYSIEKSDILDPEWSVYLKKYSPYRNIVEAQLYSIEKVMEMLVLCIPILLFLAFIFLFNMLYMEMFYRKQEIGYLQIFHVSKYRIQRMIYMEYLLKFMKPILAGYSIYVLTSLFIFTEFQITIALSIFEFIVSMIFILLYLLLLVICPLKLMLRQPILRLIR